MLKEYRGRIEFESRVPMYIRDITGEVNGLIEESRTESGLAVVSTIHTTLGVNVMEEAERDLKIDTMEFLLKMVPEDKRSSIAQHPDFQRRGLSEAEYRHYCGNNTRLKPGQTDHDFNLAPHMRHLFIAHPSLTWPISNGALELGQFQQFCAIESHGRSNPVRQRVIDVRIFPTQEIVALSTRRLAPIQASGIFPE